MPQENLKVEWTFPTDEQEWQTLTATSAREASAVKRAARPRHAAHGLAALMLALALVGVDFWTRQTRVEPIVALAQPQATVAAEDGEMPAADVADGAEAQWHNAKVIDADLFMTVVAVHGDMESDLFAHRETRFYRHAEEGWQRVQADHTWLGAWQTIYTAHFVFRYRRVDAHAVAEAAPRLERLIEKLRRDFGLPADPLPADGSGSTITVVIAGQEERSNLRFDPRTIVVASPALRALPSGISPTTYIVQSVTYPLAALLAADLVGQYEKQWQGDTASWQLLLAALPLWAAWKAEGPLSIWGEDIVRWLYHNAHTPDPDAYQAVPDGYADLCRTYREWGLSPLGMSMPLACRSVPDQLIQRGLPMQLDELLDHQRPSVHEYGFFMWGSSVVAMATLIDYVVVTYDRPALARWIAALGDHGDWESLVPAVFGVPAADFEAGWQAYLADHYGADAR